MRGTKLSGQVVTMFRAPLLLLHYMPGDDVIRGLFDRLFRLLHRFTWHGAPHEAVMRRHPKMLQRAFRSLQILFELRRAHALRLADIFRARPVDTTTESFVFEITGPPDKVDSFIALMRELGLVEVGRTGIVGMMRGAEGA